MSKETLRMQMLSGIITESQYKTKLKEVLSNDDNIYDNLMGMDQEQLISQMMSAAEKNPELTLEDFLNQYDYDDDEDYDEDEEINEAQLNENNNPSRMIELIKMYVDNYYDGGYDSAEIALDKLNDVLNGNLDGYDKAFMAGTEDQY